jgi:hypothetical protein
MIRITDQYFWNFVFSLFFILLVVMGTLVLEEVARVPLTALTLTDFTLITLASWRLTRLFVYDGVTKFLREQFFDVVKVGRGYELQKPKTGPRRTLADLFSCPWYFGVWATAVVTFCYLVSSAMVYPTIFLALSSVATFLQLLANLVGHTAEKVKRENGEV